MFILTHSYKLSTGNYNKKTFHIILHKNSVRFCLDITNFGQESGMDYTKNLKFFK